jgi:sec-independent protein translocase protein TatB
MQIFGIGPLEFLFILVLMLLVLGPRGMVKAAREAGKSIRKLTRSPLWAEIVGTSREVRNLPAKIIKEAGIEEEVEELRRSALPPAFPQDGYPLTSPAATSKPKPKKPTASKKAAGKTTPGKGSADTSQKKSLPVKKSAIKKS